MISNQQICNTMTTRFSFKPIRNKYWKWGRFYPLPSIEFEWEKGRYYMIAIYWLSYRMYFSLESDNEE